MSDVLLQSFIYLAAAVIAVPIAKRLGLGSVLGYLIAGVFIGPVIGLVGSETQDIQHFAEFGVVMMLFLVGLELEPRMLWEMRARLLGLGGLQVVLTALVGALIAYLLGVDWPTAIAVGLIMSLSSTAIVLQTLNEKRLTRTDGGRASFSVLLFQDIAVIPILAFIPLLAIPELVELAQGAAATGAVNNGHHGVNLADSLSGWAYGLVVLAAITSVVLGGHYLTRPLFRFIAQSRLREVFTASALMLVIGIALLMTLVGLSPALGAFLAGVVLADSEFRHELESVIAPFKGILLGLFFITVGAGIDFNVLSAQPMLIGSLTLAVILVKGGILFALAKIFRLDRRDGWLFTLSLAQAGEFGFVLLSFSVQNHVIGGELSSVLLLVIALSMLLTPILFIIYDRLIHSGDTLLSSPEADKIEEKGTVIIAGVGRFGQIVNRLLVASKVSTVVLDHEPNMIETLRKFGVKSYYGDATRDDLLHSAGIEQAALLVIAIDDRSRSVELARHVRQHYPKVRIIARAFDVNHLYRLKHAGVDLAIREMFEGSVETGAEALKMLGFHPFKVEKMVNVFRRHDFAGLDQLYEVWDENPEMAENRNYLARARAHRETLSALLQNERELMHDRSERSWTPPPEGFHNKLETGD